MSSLFVVVLSSSNAPEHGGSTKNINLIHHISVYWCPSDGFGGIATDDGRMSSCYLTVEKDKRTDRKTVVRQSLGKLTYLFRFSTSFDFVVIPVEGQECCLVVGVVCIDCCWEVKVDNETNPEYTS